MHAILGILTLVALAWALSENRKAISWSFVIIGITVQFILAGLFLHSTWLSAALVGINQFVSAVGEASTAGTIFLFGYLGGGEFPVNSVSESPYLFAFRVLPQVIVFSVVVALLWHWRLLPAIVQALSWALRRTLQVSGTLGTAGAASLFLGMIETPMVIRAYLTQMTRAEFFAVMALGMSTVAGPVMILFAALLGDLIDDVVGHIVGASMINAVGALYLSRLFIPETQVIETDKLVLTLKYESSMDALTKGTQDGLSMAVNIGAMLLVLISFVALGNIILSGVTGDQTLTFELILGKLFAPLAWLIGLPWSEAGFAGALFGTKLVLNEVIAYVQFSASAELFSERSRMIILYALCGFANLGSLGILLGGLSVLVPERKNEYLVIAPKSVVCGTLVNLITGAIIGLVYLI
ncbi:MAG: nucleoside transporter C-terminal domain-containing protein [Pseudomonadota bacterium]|nr:nucleoside transporter C-terminal domain-containing protein [Pseudomonadota bacterium]